MIAIIGAMDTEIAALVSAMTDKTENRHGYAAVVTGNLWGCRAAVCRCGIGKVHAALAAQALIIESKPDLMLNIGVAGALFPEGAIGDTVVATAMVQHDVDTSPIGDPIGMISGINKVYLPCDEKYAAPLWEAAQAAGGVQFRGVIATGDQFIETQAQKTLIHERFGALVCDMEGGAIAQTAYEYGVPFGAWRCISDTMLGNGQEYAVNAAFAAERSQKVLRHFLKALA